MGQSVSSLAHNFFCMTENIPAIHLRFPDGTEPQGRRVLLHACCAPCSAAIVECMLRNGIQPTVFFSNSNIYPVQEYEIRKQELVRFLERQHIPFVEDENDHEAWRTGVQGLEKEPERGCRCLLCFKMRLLRAARYASANGFLWFATTLASSRWKDLGQIDEAGLWAAAQTDGTAFWPQNWRRGGLQQRRGELLQQNEFYNQQYCGCEFSLAQRRE